MEELDKYGIIVEDYYHKKFIKSIKEQEIDTDYLYKRKLCQK
jgi:hypothetical protein